MASDRYVDEVRISRGLMDGWEEGDDMGGWMEECVD